MPIPSRYKEIAKKIIPFQWYFLALSGVGILLSFLTILISVKYQFDLLFIHGLGFLIALWGWGLFLIIIWYGKTSKFTKRLPEIIVMCGEWFSSIFLDIWFVIGSFASLLFIWHSI